MRLIDADELEDILRRSSFWDWSIKEDKSAHEWVENIINNMDIIEVAFLCDREKCEQCNNDDCQHTKDIIHAISFDKIDNTKYIEKTPTIDAVPREWHDKCMQIEIDKRINMCEACNCVEVVRCKECVHWKKVAEDDGKPIYECFLIDDTAFAIFEDNYCSYGERREDDQE